MNVSYQLQMQPKLPPLTLNLCSSDEQQPLSNILSKSRPISSFTQVSLYPLPSHLSLSSLDLFYKPIKILHQSDHSVVVQCSSKNLSIKVAVKITQNAAKQIEILSKLRKQKKGNFTKLIEEGEGYFVMEIMQGSVRDMIEASQYIEQKIIHNLLQECVQSIQTLHNRNLIHSDIKPQNILFRHSHFFLSDFGNSFSLSNLPSLQKCGQTLVYRAPQWYSGQNIGFPIDIWGLGCVLFQVLCGESLVSMEIQDDEQYIKILQILLGEDGKNIEKRLQRFGIPSQIKVYLPLILGMLKMQASQRLSIEQIGKYLCE